MAHILPKLPYEYNSLEPYIDEQTVMIHHDKHHQAYVDRLNDALQKHPALLDDPLENLLKDLDSIPEEIRTAVRNNGGGHYAHTLYWQTMNLNGGGEPSGKLLKAINEGFSSFESFKSEFVNQAQTLFASGWVWLVKTGDDELEIVSTPNHDTPLAEGKIPILVIDVWEHAYYLKYQNKRAEYVQAWWYLINWETVNNNYQGI